MRGSLPLFAEPRVFDRVFSGEQCAALLEDLEYAYWSRSTVVDRRHGIGRVSQRRVSETTDESWFTPGINRQLRRIGGRLEKLIPGFEERREMWQATRYRRGGKFDYHLDCGSWARDPTGEREHTVLICLKAPAAGGGTHFLLLDLEVSPVAGRLLVWSNLAPDGRRHLLSLHAGLPVLRGEKTVLVTWVRRRRRR